MEIGSKEEKTCTRWIGGNVSKVNSVVYVDLIEGQLDQSTVIGGSAGITLFEYFNEMTSDHDIGD